MNLVYALIATVLIVIAYASALALAPDWWFASTAALVGVLFAGAVVVFRVYPNEKNEAMQTVDKILRGGGVFKNWDKLEESVGKGIKFARRESNDWGQLLINNKGRIETLDGKVHAAAMARV